MQQYEWTISIIVQQDGMYLFEYVELEQSILDQPFDKRIRYVIFYYEQASQRRIIKQLRKDQTTGANYFENISKWEKCDLYNPASLTDFFDNYINKNSNSDHHMLMMWCHGAGLGYFAVDPTREKAQAGSTGIVDYVDEFKDDLAGLGKDLINSLNRDLNAVAFFTSNLSLKTKDYLLDGALANFFNEKYFSRISNAIKKVTIPTIKRDLSEKLKVISAADLAGILKHSFGEKKIDLFLNVSCYTLMLETCYELRNQVIMMVAPQTTFPFGGVDYKSLFTYIHTNAFDLDAIARNMCGNFLVKYESEPYRTQFRQRWPRYPIDQVAFSAIYLKDCETLTQIIDQIGDFFLVNFNTEIIKHTLLRQIILGARMLCGDVTINENYGIIDITHFLNKTMEKGGKSNQKFALLYDEFNQHKKSSISCQIKPPALFGPDSTLDPAKNPNFLSIFFPGLMQFDDDIVKFILLNYYKGDVSSPGFFKFRWDEFIRNSFIP